MFRPAIRSIGRSVLGALLLVAGALALSACASTSSIAQDAPQPAAGAPSAGATGGAAQATGAIGDDEALPDDGYMLGQGDRIAIQVFDEPDLTMEAGVNSSGTISYSYLGDIRVADKTTDQIAREIKKLLSDGYLRNPSVNVSIVEFRPFFINGEVEAPGSYPYQPGLTLDRAIALAGGLTDRASTRKMSIMKAGSEQDEVKARMSTKIAPGDIVSIKEGFF